MRSQTQLILSVSTILFFTNFVFYTPLGLLFVLIQSGWTFLRRLANVFPIPSSPPMICHILMHLLFLIRQKLPIIWRITQRDCTDFTLSTTMGNHRSIKRQKKSRKPPKVSCFYHSNQLCHFNQNIISMFFIKPIS